MNAPRQSAAHGTNPVGTETFRPVTGTATAAKVLIAVALMSSVVLSISSWRDYLVVRDYLDGAATIADLEAADAFALLIAIPGVVVAIATGVVFLVWLWRARINAELLGGREAHRRSRGWVVGAWFVPVVNLWFPHQIVTDIWRTSAPQRPVSGRLVTAWWIPYIVSWIIGNRLLQSSFKNEITLEGLRSTANLSTLSTVLDLVAGVLIIVIITRITAWQTERRNTVETDSRVQPTVGEQPPA